jgi:hypothetical protein
MERQVLTLTLDRETNFASGWLLETDSKDYDVLVNDACFLLQCVA